MRKQWREKPGTEYSKANALGSHRKSKAHYKEQQVQRPTGVVWLEQDKERWRMVCDEVDMGRGQLSGKAVVRRFHSKCNGNLWVGLSRAMTYSNLCL